MTVRQKQHLLAFLGFYKTQVDGIWGPASQKAALAFQRQQGIGEDPDFGEESQNRIRACIGTEAEKTGWENIRFFRWEEFACKCGKCGGFPVQPDLRLVAQAEAVRSHFGAACILSSGLRCPAHNARVGGVGNSRHLLGKAMDFRIQGTSSREVLDFVRTLPVRYAYAIDGQYVHMDID